MVQTGWVTPLFASAMFKAISIHIQTNTPSPVANLCGDDGDGREAVVGGGNGADKMGNTLICFGDVQNSLVT